MDDSDDATLSVIPGSDAHALGVSFNDCERGHVVRESDRAEVIATGVLRHLGAVEAATPLGARGTALLRGKQLTAPGGDARRRPATPEGTAANQVTGPG